MKLVKNNPSWPDHADFSCPHCKGAIEDVSDYDYGGSPNEEPEMEKCPHCGENLKVHVVITWEYEVGL